MSSHKYAWLFLLVPASGWANTQLSAGYSAEYVDNAAFVPSEETSDIIHRPRLALSTAQEIQRLRLDANYTVEEEIYQDSQFGDTSIIEGRGSLNWLSPREIFTANVSNSRSERLISSSDRNTPDNRQVIDQSTAFVQAKFGSFGNQYISSAVEYEEVSAKKSDTNSSRESVSVGYWFPRGEDSIMGFEATRMEVDFDDPASVDYSSDSLRFSFRRDFHPVSVAVELGVAEIDRSRGREDFDQNTVSVEASWDLRERTSLSFAYRRGIEDNTLNQPLLDFGTLQQPIVDNSGLNEIFVDTRKTIGISTEFGRYKVRGSLEISDIDYREALSDEERRGLSLEISRAFSPRLTGRLTGYASESEFLDADRETEDMDLELSLSYQANPKLDVSLGASRFSRDDGLTVDSDIEALAIVLSVNYLVFSSAY